MLSRRHFLQLSGIALASVSLPSLTTAAFSPATTTPTLAPSLETVYGRTFATTRVYDAPSIAARIGQRLWANTVSPILDTDGDWYHLPEGYVLRENMQPMIAPAQHSETTFRPPFWAEVSGAVGIVRESCNADAGIVRQIGHGGVLRVIDWLPGDGVDWYGVTDDAMEALGSVGWTQASVWSPVQEENISPNLTLVANTNSFQMSVRDGDHVVLTAPISTGSALRSGTYTISERRVSQANFNDAEPWRLNFGNDLYLSGVYWHNQFGKPGRGGSLQVTPALARWLYPRAAEVIIS